ncbi:uncharacterized protein LOC124170633 [Ischnura elegans]|uniref:uncharacterized protein LOC124170633 n=1 Tax=Ischnura elegans TaxID=197161 RepID=UPI001ED87608|nr:uncharacterized protein LOC124170633 [Ischnura elegans]
MNGVGGEGMEARAQGERGEGVSCRLSRRSVGTHLSIIPTVLRPVGGQAGGPLAAGGSPGAVHAPGTRCARASRREGESEGSPASHKRRDSLPEGRLCHSRSARLAARRRDTTMERAGHARCSGRVSWGGLTRHTRSSAAPPGVKATSVLWCLPRLLLLPLPRAASTLIAPARIASL